jgi:hypothetical protein
MSYPTIERSIGCLVFPYDITFNEATTEKPESYDYSVIFIKESDDLMTNYINIVQALLDTSAQALGYDNIISVCTYATSTKEKFRTEGQKFVEWRDNVWDSCYTTLALVQAGEIPIPTMNELLNSLPKLEDI